MPQGHGSHITARGLFANRKPRDVSEQERRNGARSCAATVAGTKAANRAFSARMRASSASRYSRVRFSQFGPDSLPSFIASSVMHYLRPNKPGRRACSSLLIISLHIDCLISPASHVCNRLHESMAATYLSLLSDDKSFFLKISSSCRYRYGEGKTCPRRTASGSAILFE